VNWKRAHPGVVIFVAALALRLAWVLLRWAKTGAAFDYPDEELHWQLAANLFEKGTLVSDDGRFAARMPAYPLFLALFAWAGDAGVMLARLAQAVLGGASSWIAYRIADATVGRKAGWVAGLLVCFDPYGIFFANLLLTEVLFTVLALGLVACALRVLLDRKPRLGWPAIGVAILGAAAVMTRPSSAGWIGLLWVVLWLLDLPKKLATRRVTVCLAAMAVCLLPWGLRNRAVIGDPAWLSANGGITLYDAQGPQADGSSNQAFVAEMPEIASLDEVERDRRYRDLAIEQMRKDPGRVISLAWVKFRRTWSLTPNVEEHSGGATAIASAVYTGVVLLGALVALIRLILWRGKSDAARRHRRLLAQVWLPVIYFTLLHCIFIGSLRYRVPLMPMLAIAAASAWQWRSINGGRTGDEAGMSSA